ncbi:MAG: helix-turn-helix transcriptional regulator [Cutibacterium sp.]|nr:helix-turn-helix transcriptional regulator [Cutibacterium sp.]MDO4411707.1 helix-turn-helix transcriptional regulator [Cutibacterium sp.]
MTKPPAIAVSYKPLWKLLIDRELQKQDLRKMTGLSGATIAKLGRDENVTTTVLVKICEALDCDIADICEVVPTEMKRETD